MPRHEQGLWKYAAGTLSPIIAGASIEIEGDLDVSGTISGSLDVTAPLDVEGSSTTGTTQIAAIVRLSGITSVRYYLLGTLDTSLNGHLQIIGIMGGRDKTHGRAQVNIMFAGETDFDVTGMAIGTLVNCDLVVYEDTGEGKYNIYLKADSFTEFNVDMKAVGQTVTIDFDETYTELTPSGTLIYTLSTDLASTIRVDIDGNMAVGAVSPSSRLTVASTEDETAAALDISQSGTNGGSLEFVVASRDPIANSVSHTANTLISVQDDEDSDLVLNVSSSGSTTEAISLRRNSAIVFGAKSINTTTTTNYLWPGCRDQTATTVETETKLSLYRAGLLKGFTVIHAGSAGGDGDDIVYTVMKNGVSTGISVTIASDSGTAVTDSTNYAFVSAGDYVTIQVTKATDITTSPTQINAYLGIE